MTLPAPDVIARLRQLQEKATKLAQQLKAAEADGMRADDLFVAGRESQAADDRFRYAVGAHADALLNAAEAMGRIQDGRNRSKRKGRR